MRVADHREQRFLLRRTVEGEGCVEDLVAAVLGVRLGEHHQLGIAGVAAKHGIVLGEIGDLVGGEGEAETQVGGLERSDRIRGQGDAFERAGRAGIEQALQGRHLADDRLRHRVMQGGDHAGPFRRCGRRRGFELEGGAALDARHGETATAQDVGGLARPRRDRAEPGHHPQGCRSRRTGEGIEDGGEALAVGRRPGLGLDEADMTRGDDATGAAGLLERGVVPVDAERGQGRLAVENDHGGHVEKGRA